MTLLKSLRSQLDSSLHAKEKQMMKDRVMAREADWGRAVFKPISKTDMEQFR